MNIEIRKLMPEMVDDYVNFFDTTPHDDHIDKHKCYCVSWCSDDFLGKDFSTVEKRRKQAYEYVRSNKIQGYLAYYNGKVVGWCNANTKSECTKCAGWRAFMNYVPLDDKKVKSIFCFTIAPEMKRKGVATSLLKRVCDDAKQEGFEFVEAYPYKEEGYQSSNYGGYVKMYEKLGFKIFLDTSKGLIMRKNLN
ncbi:MAG TPA: GNAT family N-acetyltransferase [Acholeplasmataceae bacterium]|jgi:GNAT superfamily N-acetyltransferase|nr:GNAT family N-acetyltransferase [Acholeplasmataceae bacterium]